MEKYIMSIDQGTTSSRVIIFNHDAKVVSSAQKEFQQYFPKPGWVEHDANEIWLSVLSCMMQSMLDANIKPEQIEGIGITNQRETTVVWDKKTGIPVYKAIVWQSRQTAEICNQLKQNNHASMIREKTGLQLDPYFSATKIRWILDHIENGQQRAESGELLAGTIDTWLIWCLSGMKAHVTDYSNASRTMLFNIYDNKWDDELCCLLNIPMCMLPEVKDSSCIFAYTASEYFFGKRVPIAGAAGDQQAALFGQQCFERGSVKNTYGTGCFMLMNTGNKPHPSKHGLVTTIAWGYQGEITYALEGSVFVAGSAVQWLRDQLKFFKTAKESEKLALSAKEEHELIVVPAFVGLGAPYWDNDCKGAMFGITRGTSKEDMTKATLDSIAYQNRDILDAMKEDSGIAIQSLRVDGGASANDYLMQFQSDIMQCAIERPENVESTALGAAYLAGLAVGYWHDLEELKKERNSHIFAPMMDVCDVSHLYKRWQKAVACARMFTKNEE